jgi:hypothetical protein
MFRRFFSANPRLVLLQGRQSDSYSSFRIYLSDADIIVDAHVRVVPDDAVNLNNVLPTVFWISGQDFCGCPLLPSYLDDVASLQVQFLHGLRVKSRYSPSKVPKRGFGDT